MFGYSRFVSVIQTRESNINYYPYIKVVISKLRLLVSCLSSNTLPAHLSILLKKSLRTSENQRENRSCPII